MTVARAISTGSLLEGTTALVPQLLGVSPDAWRRLVGALALGEDGRPRPLGAVSRRGGLGCFEIRARRLQDLGHGRAARRTGGVWEIAFRSPLSRERFLASLLQQYDALSTSLARFDAQVAGLPRPEGASRSGVLAVLQRVAWEAEAFAILDRMRRRGVREWAAGRKSLVDLYARCNDLF